MDCFMLYATADTKLAKSLERYDTRRRIAWLRDRTNGYVQDLSARFHLKISCLVAGHAVEDPESEALQAVIGIGIKANLTPEEIRKAFMLDWEAGIIMARKLRQRCERIAAQQIQLYRRRDGIYLALIDDTKNWPADWPFLSSSDLATIAARFERHPNQGDAT